QNTVPASSSTERLHCPSFRQRSGREPVATPLVRQDCYPLQGNLTTVYCRLIETFHVLFRRKPSPPFSHFPMAGLLPKRLQACYTIALNPDHIFVHQRVR